jgi:Putative auto-transporter adhesin, head GIN domain
MLSAGGEALMTTAPTPLDSGQRARHGHRFAFVAILALVVVGVTIAIAFAIASNSSTSSNTVQGSGVHVTESRTVPAFGSVDLAGSNNVFIRVGEEQSVQVYGDDNLIDRVTTDVDATTLVIGSKPGSYSTSSPMRVEVSVPSLRDLTLSGSGTVMVSGVDGRRFTVTISGSGVVRASGTTERLDATVSGSGQAELGGVEASAVHAVVSGSGEIVVTATVSLDASVPGSGSIMYGGNPNDVTKSVTGSGEIIP